MTICEVETLQKLIPIPPPSLCTDNSDSNSNCNCNNKSNNSSHNNTSYNRSNNNNINIASNNDAMKMPFNLFLDLPALCLASIIYTLSPIQAELDLLVEVTGTVAVCEGK